MRRVALLILALCFLTSATTPVFSEKPLRLFFEKNIQVETAPKDGHTVKEGEWLFKILTDKGFSGSQISEMMPRLESLNPHIPDINKLRPGQVIQLPDHVAQPEQDSRESRPSSIPQDSYDKIPYVIRPGDTLIEVLQSQGVPTTLIYGGYMNLVLELNPSVPNTNALKVGKTILLPIQKSTASAQASETPTPQAEEAKPVPEDAARTAGIETSTPASETNPSTLPIPEPREDVPRVPPAPLPEPPAPPIAALQPLANSTGGENTSSFGNATETRQRRTGLPFVRTILEQMRFRFLPGDEIMYPLQNSGWLHVKLAETPVVETPWGQKLILCPVPKNSEWIKNANALNIQVCTVSPQWSLQDILEKLAVTFPTHIRMWGADRELVLSRNGISVTLESPQLAIVEHGEKKSVYMVWARQTQEERPLPQGLPEVLEPAQIKIIELDAFNELSRLPTRPRQSIYVPVASTMELIQAINPKDPETLFGKALPENLAALLQLLRSKDMLQQSMVQASWFGGVRSRISVQIPAWTVSPSAQKIALLDRRFADEYLVSVLSHEGYTCFVLPD